MVNYIEWYYKAIECFNVVFNVILLGVSVWVFLCFKVLVILVWNNFGPVRV